MHDLRDKLENKARQSRSIYGSRGRAPTCDDDRHTGYTKNKSGRAEYSRPDSFEQHRHVLWRAPVIRRSILHVLLCYPIYLAGPACYPGPWYFCSTGDGVRAGIRPDMPLCLGHEVAGQPHHTLEA